MKPYIIVFAFVYAVVWGSWCFAHSSKEIVEQIVYVNIPAYRLSLYTKQTNGQWEQLTIPVGVGKGLKKKTQTPTGKGVLYAKATGVTFQYGPQNPPELVGKTISHSNTFDQATLQPVTIKMPSDMRSLFMRLTGDTDAQFYTQFVLHETTDWYTVGTPASSGCMRIEREDMQRLYQTIAPLVSEGNLTTPVPIITYYDVAEYYPDRQMVVLHANIYQRKVDYVHEVLRDLQEAGIDSQLMNIPALIDVIQQAEAQFEITLNTIYARLRKPPFERLVHDHEKQLLHFPIYLRFQY
jgi:hypothetical protein